MKIWKRLSSGPQGRRAIRLAVVAASALILPLALIAQAPQGGVRQTRSAASATPQTPDDRVIHAEGYQVPQKALADAVLAPRYLNDSLSNLSPDKKWFIKQIGDGPVVMKTFSKPFDELGGLFIDFKANRSRTLTISNGIGIELISAADGTKKTIQLPPGARVSNATWSPDSRSIAYFVDGDDSTQIWMADVATLQSHQITTTPVLATLVTNFNFTEDGKEIATVLVPDGRGPRPAAAGAVPTGPEVKVSEGEKASLRTFPSLMKTPQDFELLQWHATGQVALIDVATKAITKIGAPAMVRAIDVSPDGQYLRVTRMTKPFSYIVPVNSFGSAEEVWDRTGKALTTVSTRPINLGATPDDTNPPDPNAPPQVAAGGGGGRGGRGGGANGKRELAWRTDGPGFTYLEQEPGPPGTTGGNGGGRAGRGGGGRGGARAGGGQAAPQGPPRKDRLMEWLPPFDATSTKVIYENPTGMSNARFSSDHQVLFYNEAGNGATTIYAVYLSDPTQRYAVQVSRGGGFGGRGAAAAGRAGADADVNNGGTLVGVRGGGGGGGRGGGGGGARGGGAGGGGPVLLSADKTAVFFEGTTYDKNPEQVGPKTFIDRVVIKTGEKSNLFTSDNNGVWEHVSSIIDPDTKTFVLVRESPTETPQDVLVSGSTRTPLTQNKDIALDLTNAPKVHVVVTRPDGFHFTVRVTLPPGYQAGTRLPALFWLYPSEYETQEAHDRTGLASPTSNKNAFQNLGTRSMEFFCRLGYAVIEDTTPSDSLHGVPIVGPAGTENDNYVDDLRNDLLATIDELDRRGLIDRQRLAIGGHSYGAFTTVNAMVHTGFFKAGIAGDGNYNRTLTPFGFQNEHRTLWQAPNVYFAMSPLFYANHLTGALLLYHDLHDQNVGTDPINSERLFEALNELGKTVAMYRYPFEDHGPVARETLLDMWARWGAWLDKYVKNATPVNAPAPASTRGGSR